MLRLIGATALCLMSCLIIVWATRKTIATAVIDRKLAQAHVSARYRIVDLGWGGQRLVNVVIGDPHRPDLTASWLELRTRIGLDGAQVTTVRAGGLRLRASLANGRLSLGQIDRLLPRSTGNGPFRLPAIDLDMTDGRVRLTSAPGVIDLVLSGRGRLDDGFSGRLAAASPHLVASGCTADRVSLKSEVGIDRGAVKLTGPLGVQRLACQGGAATNLVVDLDATLARGLAAWSGRAAARADHLIAAALAMTQATGRVTFAGSAGATIGEARLGGGPARIGTVTSRALGLFGRYRLSSDPAFVGKVSATGVSLPPAMLSAVRQQEHGASATPIAPLLHRAAGALVHAADDFAVTAQIALTRRAATLTRLDGVAQSGARAAFAADRPITMAWATMPAIAGTVRLSGGSLPTATIRLDQSTPQGPISGVATILPYAADGARLALDPIHFTASRAGAHIITVATMSGPLADGRVEGLRVPIVADRDATGVLRLGLDCITLSFDRLAVSTLRLRAARLPLCPTGPELVRVAAGKVEGGARVATLRLMGSLGSTPLSLAAEDTYVTFGNSGVTTRNVVARLGEGAAATQLTIGRLLGTASTTGLGGRFDNAAGQIGKVPLLLSNAGGDWRFGGGALAVLGTATVADSTPAARFRALRADGLKMRLAGGTIEASAQLVAPAKAIPIAGVVIGHDFGSGAGTATLSVPRLAFTDAFQPDELTPLTFGVVADVRGNVTGDARIGWNPRGVTSTGTFHTDGLDLAAAFGPVTGLATTIRFTDLLAMESAPDQIATVASINPGIPVTDGRFLYRIMANSRVQVTSGHWPFAGGALDLRPTMLDLGAPSERRLTFDLDGVDAGRFLQQFDFGNLSATGTFDGTLPMVFDATGGRIEGGRLKVRPGGGNLAYVGNLTQKDLGLWGNLAFQALRSIDYRDLAIAMNGPLAGEMVTEVRFAGISQGKGARSNFLIRRLQKLPFVFNIRIRAPFRGLIDSAQSFYDPSRLVVRNLPALIQQQNDGTIAPAPVTPIQPAAREAMP